ncbi:hypothetical protein CSKR_103262 [Clonorchis sinensis]|uniref:Uncharacterized protein n=1 Tax=Clonorchis sinensis TaxID=79923 RepID=A0A3R7FY63_CLOSI|nr:hypothetical protein CSKR_103262 [Clonorchis sinensis]
MYEKTCYSHASSVVSTVTHLPPLKLQTIEQGSKTLICISFTKLNIPLLLERVFLNFLWIFIDCYSNAGKCYKETPQIP